MKHHSIEYMKYFANLSCFCRFVVQEIHKHQNLEPVPDYAESEEDEDDVNLPSELGETADDNEVYSMHSSVRTSYTNQVLRLNIF